MNAELYFRYKNYDNDQLLSIIEKGTAAYSKEALQIASKILIERNIEIPNFNQNITPNLSTAEAKTGYRGSFVPLLLAIILLYIGQYLNYQSYNYELGGGSTDTKAIEYISDFGLLHNIVSRVIIIGVILHYGNKVKGRSVTFWIIFAILGGAWSLLLFGVNELLSLIFGSSKKDDNENDELPDEQI